MTHVLHRFVKRLTVLVGVLGAVLLGIALPASASTASGSLAAGNTMCTDQTGSAGGVRLSGTVTTPTPTAGVTWTVRAATRPGPTAAADTVVFRAETADVTGRTILPTHAGTLYYRLCLANTTSAAVRFANVNAVAIKPAGTSSTGPTTALLSTGGTVCGERIAKSGHLRASSSAPVTWVVRGFSGNEPTPSTRRLLTVTSTSVDANFGAGSFAFLDVCAIDRSPASSTAKTAIAMQFTAN
jgi:hypothetical protein